MEPVARLPLPAEELPEGIRKFGDPKAPAGARMMAAKGLVPVKGNALVTLLVQLACDKDTNLSKTAGEQLDNLPDGVLLGACAGELHPAIVDELARRYTKRNDVLERIIQNPRTADATIATIAKGCDEATSELIATNQQRLLGAPAIIEALYLNRNTRMSTADRLVELAARNDVKLEGIPAFDAHVQAIQGQLIPEPTDEALPSDEAFQEALEMDDADPEAIERDKVDGTEQVKDEFKPLHHRYREMTVSEKIRMTVVGDAAFRAMAVRDPNKIVSYAAISSPRMTESEAVAIAHSKEVGDDVLRVIGNRKEWVRNYEVKRALVTNPKTPVGLAMRYLTHLRDNDLKALSRSRNVPQPIKVAAGQRLQMKQRRGS